MKIFFSVPIFVFHEILSKIFFFEFFFLGVKGQILKNLKLAGNGPKHVVLTWNEFWSWKKLKNRDLKFSKFFPLSLRHLGVFWWKIKNFKFGWNWSQTVCLVFCFSEKLFIVWCSSNRVSEFQNISFSENWSVYSKKILFL